MRILHGLSARANGTRSGGASVTVRSDLEWAALLGILSDKLGIPAAVVYTAEGDTVSGLAQLSSGMLLYVSQGEPFVRPEPIDVLLWRMNTLQYTLSDIWTELDRLNDKTDRLQSLVPQTQTPPAQTQPPQTPPAQTQADVVETLPPVSPSGLRSHSSSTSSVDNPHRKLSISPRRRPTDARRPSIATDNVFEKCLDKLRATQQELDAKAAAEKPKRARAVQDFHSGEPDQLSFRTGEEIVVLMATANGPWLGELRGKMGYFPCDSVVVDDGSPLSLPSSPLPPASSPPPTTFSAPAPAAAPPAAVAEPARTAADRAIAEALHANTLAVKTTLFAFLGSVKTAVTGKEEIRAGVMTYSQAVVSDMVSLGDLTATIAERVSGGHFVPSDANALKMAAKQVALSSVNLVNVVKSCRSVVPEYRTSVESNAASVAQSINTLITTDGTAQ